MRSPRAIRPRKWWSGVHRAVLDDRHVVERRLVGHCEEQRRQGTGRVEAHGRLEVDAGVVGVRIVYGGRDGTGFVSGLHDSVQ